MQFIKDVGACIFKGKIIFLLCDSMKKSGAEGAAIIS